MTLEVWTARIGTRDPDALDITRGSGKGALAFAPSEAILWPAINARRLADKLRAEAAEEEAREEGAGVVRRRRAEEIEEQAWVDYEPKFMAEMRVSFGMQEGHKDYGALERLAVEHGVRPDKGAWRALLARPRVVLVCYCIDPEQCHRRLLARILAKCGAVDRGELQAPAPAVRNEETISRLASRDLKPVNVELEREELEEIVAGLRVLVEEWRDVA